MGRLLLVLGMALIVAVPAAATRAHETLVIQPLDADGSDTSRVFKKDEQVKLVLSGTVTETNESGTYLRRYDPFYCYQGCSGTNVHVQLFAGVKPGPYDSILNLMPGTPKYSPTHRYAVSLYDTVVKQDGKLRFYSRFQKAVVDQRFSGSWSVNVQGGDTPQQTVVDFRVQISGKPNVSKWTGVWKSSFGTVTLRQSADVVTGTSTYKKGKFTGRADGDVLEGKWSQEPSYAGPKDAGTFEWRLTDGGKSFSGSWAYDDGAGTRGKWNGRCLKGDCLLVSSNVSGNGHATFTKKKGVLLEATETKGKIVHEDVYADGTRRRLELGIISGTLYSPDTERLALLLRVKASTDPDCPVDGAGTLTLIPVAGVRDQAVFSGVPYSKSIGIFFQTEPCKRHGHDWENGSGRVTVRIFVSERKS